MRIETAPPAAEPPVPSSRVLVVDNDLAVLEAMRTLLNAWHCDVAAACDIASARAAFVAQAPELLLFDYHLDADVTGLALRDALGAAARAVPCVIITADHDPAIRAEVEAAGCLLLYKPLKPLALKSVMARLMAARQADQAPRAGASITK